MSSVAQLSLDGGEVDVSGVVARGPLRGRRLPPRLTPAQREIIERIAREGRIRSLEAGVIAHQHRGYCASAGSRDASGCSYVGRGCCAYASTDGLAALHRLQARGLVRRSETAGVWVQP